MNTTNSYFTPEREREFRLYIIWKSLDHTMTSKLFIDLGISDDILVELADIKSQKQFGTKYVIDTKTMSNWNKHIHAGNIDPEYKELDWRYWARQASPRVASAVLKQLIKHGDAPRANWWSKVVDGFEEKSQHKIEGFAGLAELIAGADKVLKEHGESI